MEGGKEGRIEAIVASQGPVSTVGYKRNYALNAYIKFVKAVIKTNLLTSLLVRRGRLYSWTDKYYYKKPEDLFKGATETNIYMQYVCNGCR